ncbi:MAG TPA: alpha/beta fold hydrolase [Polyangiaceae bacterium]|nr:alpha/beta fold hydrolase [Polyangiaceae bacterium]
MDNERLLFLPGASGNTEFWRPVAQRLSHPGERGFISYPGFGGVPADPNVRSFDDLISRVAGQITGPVSLLAQSMGGTLAVPAALVKPELVRSMVLTVTSGGVDVTALGAQNWRPIFRRNNPHLPTWFEEHREDLSERIRQIRAPVLLLWGDADPISPVAVGERLAKLLPCAELVVLRGGTHDLVLERSEEVVGQIDRFYARVRATKSANSQHPE